MAELGDVVVAKTDPPLLSSVIAPVARAKRLVQINWLQDLYPEVALGLGLDFLKPFSRFLTSVRNASLRASGCNVAIGELMSRRLLENGLAPDRVMVIHNWSDDQSVHPVAPAGNPLRADWGLQGKFVVGYSGNLGRAHEYDTLLAAAQLLKDEADVVFLFIGGGHQHEMMKQEIQRRGLDPQFPVSSIPAGRRVIVLAIRSRRALDLSQAGDGRPDRSQQVLWRCRRGASDHRGVGRRRRDWNACTPVRLRAQRSAWRRRRPRQGSPVFEE